MGTPIIARYEDALKYIQNTLIDYFVAARKAAKDGVPMEFSARVSAVTLASSCELLAFIYGKTGDQVTEDVSRMLEESKEMYR